jgi:polysaccharide export outer membrane protein
MPFHRFTRPRRLFALLLGLLVAGCSSFTDLPPGTVSSISSVESAVIERQAVTVAPEPVETVPSGEYRVGPGDVLYINVNGRPEMGSPVLTGSGKVLGSRVDGAGQIHLPIIGPVTVSGLTIGEIQTLLQKQYAPLLKQAWVVVEVADFRSQPLYLLGQFRSAGTHYMDRPLTLLQGLALGNGLLDAANLRSARLIRDGRPVPVDLFQLLMEGAPAQNVWLRSGDTIFVPDDRNQNVFVFGAVAKPGPVPMPNGRLTLPQALASAGIGETRGQTEYVRIIRSLSPTRGELLVVDLNRIMRGQALPYPLLEGDIIYVPRSAVGNWNQAITELLPTLQAVSAVLQPFVQIKFLTEND